MGQAFPDPPPPVHSAFPLSRPLSTVVAPSDEWRCGCSLALTFLFSVAGVSPPIETIWTCSHSVCILGDILRCPLPLDAILLRPYSLSRRGPFKTLFFSATPPAGPFNEDASINDPVFARHPSGGRLLIFCRHPLALPSFLD